MKILAVGGGSGGHVTPVVAVLRELKQRDAQAEVRFWCDRKFATQARSIMHHFDASIPVETIVAGKLRRYHNLPMWRQLLRPVSIVLPNLRDMLLVAVGSLQSFAKLLLWRPDVVFTKGGYVCLPVGLAAHLLRIPLVIHDSDAHPGLTNRILARWATTIATGAPLKYYPYPKSHTHYVGIPVAAESVPFSPAKKSAVREELGVSETRPLVVITGGGLGAGRINDAAAEVLDQLLQRCSVILISGTAQYDELRALTPQDNPYFQLHAFVSHGMIDMLGAADIVVARAGMTTILELAGLQQTTILVPNGFLTGGHQLKNAAVYLEKDAVLVVDDTQLVKNSQLLADAIESLLDDPARRQQLATNLHTFAKPHAANDVADMIQNAAK